MSGSAGTGSPETPQTVALNSEEKSGLVRLHSALEKLYLAEAELARVRADLVKKGIRFSSSEEQHW